MPKRLEVIQIEAAVAYIERQVSELVELYYEQATCLAASWGFLGLKPWPQSVLTRSGSVRKELLSGRVRLGYTVSLVPLTSDTRLGPYAIIAPLGAGGMGEVYRARDTRLDRTVAIKVLPAQAADNLEARQRFEREARAVSALNHPHICTLYDVGRQDGIDFLVMEYLEGESLSQRLAAGLLPPAEALRYAVHIAEALAEAHRHGVLHRDLKPGNIMLTKAGAKLLDFGLAKLREEPAAGLGSSLMPTRTKDLTQKGAVLGTIRYMAPEQLEGQEADARSDIFSFGAVLYEMLAGRQAFVGESLASVISAIMTSQPPPVSTLVAGAPALDHILQKCLAKDPEERWQTAHDLAGELKWIVEDRSPPAAASAVAAAPTAGPVQAARSPWRGMAVAGVAALLVAAGVLIGGWLRPKPVEPGAVRFQLAFPEDTAPGDGRGLAQGPGQGAPQLALSPDGRKLAFVAVDRGARPSLWIRSLDSFSAQRLSGTEGAAFPFWSPDGQFVGFFADGKLKRIAFAGGSPLSICDAKAGQGGAWNRDGVIVFAPDLPPSPLYRVPAAGGVATPLTTLDTAGGEFLQCWPQFLPDGRHFLYLGSYRDPGKSGIFAQALGSGERKLLLNSGVRAAYAPPGYLLFVREGTLLAQPLDEKALRVRGEPVSVAQDVAFLERLGRAAFHVSETGVLVYRTGRGGGGANNQLAWYDRQGKRLQTAGEPGLYTQIALSPDEKRVAVQLSNSDRAGSDLWLLELASGVFSRLTFEPGYEMEPTWSPDSQRLVYTTSAPSAGGPAISATLPRSDKQELREIVVASGASTVLYADDMNKFPDDWSRDGRFLVYHSGGQIVSLLPLTGERKPQILLNTPYRKDELHFSPDGRWLAYHSFESGRFEIYVASVPSLTQKRQVSSGGGYQPLWRADGKELFFLSLDQKMMVADVKTAGAVIETGIPKALFQTDAGDNTAFNQYAVSGNGQRFLINGPVARVAEPVSHINVVLNFAAQLHR